MGQAHLRSFLWKGGEGKGHGGKQGASQHPVFVFLSISMQFGCNVQVGQSWVVGALVLVILFTAVGSKCSVLMRRLAAGLGGGASSGAELPVRKYLLSAYWMPDTMHIISSYYKQRWSKLLQWTSLQVISGALDAIQKLGVLLFHVTLRSTWYSFSWKSN